MPPPHTSFHRIQSLNYPITQVTLLWLLMWDFIRNIDVKNYNFSSDYSNYFPNTCSVIVLSFWHSVECAFSWMRIYISFILTENRESQLQNSPDNFFYFFSSNLVADPSDRRVSPSRVPRRLCRTLKGTSLILIERIQLVWMRSFTIDWWHSRCLHSMNIDPISRSNYKMYNFAFSICNRFGSIQW